MKLVWILDADGIEFDNEEINNIFHIINFITHQNTDNWFRLYSDLSNLDKLIKLTILNN